jgi:hypothetical protein
VQAEMCYGVAYFCFYTTVLPRCQIRLVLFAASQRLTWGPRASSRVAKNSRA